MSLIPDQLETALPAPAQIVPRQGGITFREAAPMLATVVDNGVCPDDPRVKLRTNEATKIVLDNMIPVGGMCMAEVAAVDTMLVLPPEMENIYEAVPQGNTAHLGDRDIKQGWYNIVNDSVYLDPMQQHDNPLIDFGLWSDPENRELPLRRTYQYPGLQPPTGVVRVTGAKRYLPIKTDDDFLIVQNIEALKLVILSIERNENASPDEAMKYRQQAFELLQAEVKKHILDPRNYMFRAAAYEADIANFAENTLGWLRGQLAIDVVDLLRIGKQDLLMGINQNERRIMQRGTYKDCIVQISATVRGGMLYFPLDVGCVLAIDLNGRPIPIRSQFFQYLENGPGMFPAHPMLIDQGDDTTISKSPRRKYKLVATGCTEDQVINTVCKLRWRFKKADDFMVIKHYEVHRLMMVARLHEIKEEWDKAQANQQQAFDILDKELQDYLGGIKHTPQIQTYGFGLGHRGCYPL